MCGNTLKHNGEINDDNDARGQREQRDGGKSESDEVVMQEASTTHICFPNRPTSGWGCVAVYKLSSMKQQIGSLVERQEMRRRASFENDRRTSRSSRKGAPLISRHRSKGRCEKCLYTC